MRTRWTPLASGAAALLGTAPLLAQPSVSGPSLPDTIEAPPAEGAVHEPPPPAPKERRPCRVCPLFRGGFATFDTRDRAEQDLGVGRGYGFVVALGLRLYVVSLGFDGTWQLHNQKLNPLDNSSRQRALVNVFSGSLEGGLRSPPLAFSSKWGLIAGVEAGYSWLLAAGEGRDDPPLEGGPFVEPMLAFVLHDQGRPGLGLTRGSMGAPGIGISLRDYVVDSDLGMAFTVTLGMY